MHAKHLHVGALLLALLVVAPVSAAGELIQKIVHVAARDTAVLNPEGIKVPKLYVLDGAGRLVFEGIGNATQTFPPVIEALQSGRSQPGPATVLFELLQANGHHPAPGQGRFLVSLEGGQSLAPCSSCIPYYPKLEQALRSRDGDTLWIRVHVEANDSPLATSR